MGVLAVKAVLDDLLGRPRASDGPVCDGSLADDADRGVKITFVSASGDQRVYRHGCIRVGVDLRYRGVLDRVVNEGNCGQGRSAVSHEPARIVAHVDALRRGQDAAELVGVVVRLAAVRGREALIAGALSALRRAPRTAPAITQRLVAAPVYHAQGIRHVQRVEAIDASHRELGARVILPIVDPSFPQVDLDSSADVVEGELDIGAVQKRVVRQLAHHAVSIAEHELGVIALASDSLGDSLEAQQAGEVRLPTDGAPAVAEIDQWVAGLRHFDLDQGNDLLHLIEKRRLQRGRRKARLGGVQRVRRGPGGDLDERHSDAGDGIRDLIDGERLVFVPAGD